MRWKKHESNVQHNVDDNEYALCASFGAMMTGALDSLAMASTVRILAQMLHCIL